MRKKKIIRIIARLNVGGPAIHTILLSSALNANGYEDILICGQPSEFEGDMTHLAHGKNLKPYLIPELGREISLVKDIKAFFKLYSLMRREKPDIVHTHTAKAGALGRLAAILAGVPIKVHTFHGHIFDGYFSPLKARFFLLIERFLALFTDKVIAVSECVRDDIVNRLKVTKSDKCAVISLGLELEKFLNCRDLKGLFRKSIGVGEEVLLVGIVGRLVPIKNHRMFLDIASKLKARFPDIKAKFVIVGDGELRDEIKRYAAAFGLENDVVFTGWVEDLPAVYADLDVVALTSLNEGTPVSLIEAMASGKAVVATDVGGVRNLIDPETNGFLVKQEKGSSDTFCQILASLLRDPVKMEKIGSNGRRKVIDKYTKERLVRDIEALYEELMSKKVEGLEKEYGRLR